VAAAYEILTAPGKVIRTIHEEAARSLKPRRGCTFSDDRE